MLMRTELPLHKMMFCAIYGNNYSSYLLQLDKEKAGCYIKTQLNTAKAGNETSRLPAKLREPG